MTSFGRIVVGASTGFLLAGIVLPGAAEILLRLYFLALAAAFVATRAYGAAIPRRTTLAVLLFLAGELNTLSWECRGPFPMSAVQRRRLLDALALSLLALAGVLVVEAVVAVGVAGGRVAVALAALALGSLGLLMFQGGGAGSTQGGSPR